MKYINADDYKELIKREKAKCYPADDEFEDGCKTGLGISVEVIDEMPSADVVEVVRCKDCKHSIKEVYGGVISYEYLCVLKSTVTHLEEHEANYFCADGERSETE